MSYDASILNYFIHASLVVKCVMVILIGCSIFSWAYILQRYFYVKEIKNKDSAFSQIFDNASDLGKLYLQEKHHAAAARGIEAIFRAGYKEFTLFRRQATANLELIIENTKRAMRIAQMREQDKLEKHLSFLAIVASTSPYVGLFGTVWGIMQAFTALANVQQATISMVAPGIAEALIATALGLFAAIPASVAYNRLVNVIGQLQNHFDAFQEEMTNTLIRDAQPIAQTTLQTQHQPHHLAMEVME